VVLKLSGEAFAGDEPLGHLSGRGRAHRAGDHHRRAGRIEIAAVVGGGNMFRGAVLSRAASTARRADYMGMLGTVINCLALQDVLEKLGVETGSRPRSRWARWPSLTSRAALSGTWRRAGS